MYEFKTCILDVGVNSTLYLRLYSSSIIFSAVVLYHASTSVLSKRAYIAARGNNKQASFTHFHCFSSSSNFFSQVTSSPQRIYLVLLPLFSDRYFFLYATQAYISTHCSFILQVCLEYLFNRQPHPLSFTIRQSINQHSHIHTFYDHIPEL